MKNRIIIVVVVLVVGAGGFYGGMKYQQSQLPSGARFLLGAVGNQRPDANANFRGGEANAGMTSGEILALDDESITVKLRNGGSKIIFYSGATQFQKMANTTISDFEIGKQIIANGTANSDGSIIAQSIQLRPDVQPKQ